MVDADFEEVEFPNGDEGAVIVASTDEPLEDVVAETDDQAGPVPDQEPVPAGSHMLVVELFHDEPTPPEDDDEPPVLVLVALIVSVPELEDEEEPVSVGDDG